MYITRSEQNRQKKQEAAKRRKRKIKQWLLLNTVLIAGIVLVGVYYWSTSMSSPRTSSESTVTAITDQVTDGSTIAEEEQENTALEDEDLHTKESESPSSDLSESDNDKPDQAADLSDNHKEQDHSVDSLQTAPTAADSQTAAPVTLEESSETKPDGQTVTLHFGGDVMFSGKVGELLAKKGYDYPYEYVKNLFTTDDLTIVNLETPVTSSATTAADKTYAFKSSPEALPHMKAAGIDAVNLANNHILDQGITGLTDTIRQLDKSGIAYVGAGSDRNRAYEPVYFERKGMKIAVLGFSRVIPETSWNAGDSTPGVATAYDSTAAEAAIKQAKTNADLVVVIAHWGVERSDTLVDHQTDLAHRFVDAGADLVVGGHPHVLQELEQYKGKWIAYSTGNFIFTRSLTEKTWDTGVFQAICSAKGDCSMQVIPYTAELGRPVPMAAEQAQTLLKRLQTLSGTIRFDMKGHASP